MLFRSLLEKIVLRYEKQFAKKELNVNELVKLPWNVEPILSLPKFTQASISVNDNTIEIVCPFKS